MRHLDLLAGRLKFDRMTLFLAPIFFIFLADSVMGYTFPIIAERHLLSHTLLGLIMASSSVAGIICDLLFPGLLRNRGWGTQFLMGVGVALLFPLSIHFSIFLLPIFFALLGAIVWGIYFELLQFSMQGMVTEEKNPDEYSRSWGLIYTVILITTSAGPILGSLLLKAPVLEHTTVVLVLQVTALLLASLIVWRMKSRRHIDNTCTGPRCRSAFGDLANIVRSAKSWEILLGAVFPAIIMGITMKWIEATYWTLGGLFGQSVGGDTFGWVVLVLYEVPLLLGAVTLSRLHITAHKKRLSQFVLIAGGLLLALVGLAAEHTLVLYAIIAVSSLAFSFAYPLNDAVYSDLIERLNIGKLELIGLAKANASLSYIAAPIIMGMVADHTDYFFVFSMLGVVAAAVGVFLLLVTPRKLRLPQSALASLK